MSDKPEKDQKVHDPSSQRLQKAVEEGNILRSREILSVGMMAGGMAVLLISAPFMLHHLRGLTMELFLAAGTTQVTPETVPGLLANIMLKLVLMVAPLLGVLTVFAIGLNVMQSGFVITPKALVPKFNRLSPMQGAKRIFSMKGLFEAGKGIFKLVVVGGIAYVYVSDRVPEILGLHRMPTSAILTQVGVWMMGLTIRCVGALLFLAALDFVYEKRHRWNELKMTTEEVKRESKEQEGDPHLKGKRKAKARELSQRRPRLMDAVLQADVVVTNPTHYAVALKYDPVLGGAPRVLVKGIRKRALAIKGLALEHGVPTVEDRPTARALYAAVPEGGEIPDTLYAAVAAILAEVFRAREARF